MRFLCIALFFSFIVGCSSTSVPPIQHHSYDFYEDDVSTPVVPDWVNLIDGYPVYLDTNYVGGGLVGSACSRVQFLDMNRHQSAKRLTQDKARLSLFKLYGGEQKLFAREHLVDDASGKSLSVEIKNQSSGRIGRTVLIAEDYSLLNEQVYYCAAVGELSIY